MRCFSSGGTSPRDHKGCKCKGSDWARTGFTTSSMKVRGHDKYNFINGDFGSKS
jgi:hypothetical protein